MLFVRTEGILHTMIEATLLIAGLIVVGFTMPIQNSFGLTRSLDLIIYADGSTHITSEFEVDSQQPDFEIDLFGSTVDNFVAIGENGKVSIVVCLLVTVRFGWQCALMQAFFLSCTLQKRAGEVPERVLPRIQPFLEGRRLPRF